MKSSMSYWPLQELLHFSIIENIDEISTHAFFGSEIHPTAIRECLPLSESISQTTSEAPIDYRWMIFKTTF